VYPPTGIKSLLRASTLDLKGAKALLDALAS
jgi:hypothetical protein